MKELENIGIAYVVLAPFIAAVLVILWCVIVSKHEKRILKGNWMLLAVLGLLEACMVLLLSSSYVWSLLV